jgi:hypothetical protein
MPKLSATFRGRIDIVGALAHVDVVERVQRAVLALRASHDLERAVGDDFVGVHVGGGARAALDHVHHEFLVQRAAADLLAGPGDGRRFGGVEQAELEVGERGRMLDARKRLHQVRVDRDRGPADRKILQCAQGMHAVVGSGGQLPVAEQVVFDADGCGHRALRLGGILGGTACLARRRR